ncbi:hypothetical protein A0H81_12820 [Grifola frondosa]|uniref:Tyrosinase copper-binding domain-containing protein n=1 Tax=Grifola frondosa TaxID=5627 RepID=A0A1C7LW21_GRIFR|nr:hypothetical protein A0H81_12820 [Grifola frondosa]
MTSLIKLLLLLSSSYQSLQMRIQSTPRGFSKNGQNCTTTASATLHLTSKLPDDHGHLPNSSTPSVGAVPHDASTLLGIVVVSSDVLDDTHGAPHDESTNWRSRRHSAFATSNKPSFEASNELGVFSRAMRLIGISDDRTAEAALRTVGVEDLRWTTPTRLRSTVASLFPTKMGVHKDACTRSRSNSTGILRNVLGHYNMFNLPLSLSWLPWKFLVRQDYAYESLPFNNTDPEDTADPDSDVSHNFTKRYLRNIFILALIAFVPVFALLASISKWITGHPPLYEKGGEKYLWIANHVHGCGWGNAMQELLFNSYLRIERSEHYSSFSWKRIPSRIPLSAMIRGPSWGTFPEGDRTPRSVTQRFSTKLAPRVPSFRSEDVNGASVNPSAETIIQAWIQKLNSIDDKCVEIEHTSHSIFDIWLFADGDRLLDNWPLLSTSPIMTGFSWSTLVELAFDNNRETISPTSSISRTFPLYRSRWARRLQTTLQIPIANLIWLDRTELFPSLPDKWESIMSDAPAEKRKELYDLHCYPETDKIVERVEEIRQTNAGSGLENVYIMTNGPASWIAELKDALEAKYPWKNIASSRDLVLNHEQKYIAQAIDMLVGQRAQVFIGNGVLLKSKRDDCYIALYRDFFHRIGDLANEKASGSYSSDDPTASRSHGVRLRSEEWSDAISARHLRHTLLKLDIMFRLQLCAVVIIVTLLSQSTAEANRCKTPSIRKEWRSLSALERAEWIRAVKCLTDYPHTNALTPSVNPFVSKIPPVNKSGSFYDDFVYMHMDLNTRIHGTGLFLPFHRWYVAVYETALKDKCGFKGAFRYWNWTIDSAYVHHGTIFQEADSVSGLGGWGAPAKDFSVTDGAFTDFSISYPSPHILRRNFTLQPYFGLNAVLPIFPNEGMDANASFTLEAITALINWTPGDFVGFQFAFEQPEDAHGGVHLILGGDLACQCPINAPANCTPGPTWSANDKSRIISLQGRMVDKVWYDWQHKSASNFWAYKGGSVQNITNLQALHDYPNGMPPELSLNSTMPAEVAIRDVMNTTGGSLCYVYE